MHRLILLLPSDSQPKLRTRRNKMYPSFMQYITVLTRTIVSKELDLRKDRSHQMTANALLTVPAAGGLGRPSHCWKVVLFPQMDGRSTALGRRTSKLFRGFQPFQKKVCGESSLKGDVFIQNEQTFVALEPSSAVSCMSPEATSADVLFKTATTCRTSRFSGRSPAFHGAQK